MAKEKLTPKQLLFCKEYLIDLNATQAAIRAGYSPKTANEIGSENLTKPSIQENIAEAQKKRSDKLELNAEWVLKRFKEISDRCMQAEPVMESDGEGGKIESGEFQFDSSGANKATEMIAKHIGFFEKDNEQAKPVINPVLNILPVGDSIKLPTNENDINKERDSKWIRKSKP